MKRKALSFFLGESKQGNSRSRVFLLILFCTFSNSISAQIDSLDGWKLPTDFIKETGIDLSHKKVLGVREYGYYESDYINQFHVTDDNKYMITIEGRYDEDRYGIYHFPSLIPIRKFKLAHRKWRSISEAIVRQDSLLINYDLRSKYFTVIPLNGGAIVAKKAYSNITIRMGSAILSRGVFYKKNYLLAYANRYLVVMKEDYTSPEADDLIVRSSQKKIIPKYIGRLFAVQNYTDPSVKDLSFPHSDAQQLKDILLRKYTFDSTDITIVKDPTSNRLLQELNALKEVCSPEDYLLIFFSGHGYYEPGEQEGFWLPSDGVLNKESTLIANSIVLNKIRAINAKHILLIVDACFAGSIMETKEAPSWSIEKLYSTKCRRAITSGNIDIVPDNGVFTKYLTQTLDENTETHLTSQKLFSDSRELISNNSENSPREGVLYKTGDAGGDFIFRKRARK